MFLSISSIKFAFVNFKAPKRITYHKGMNHVLKRYCVGKVSRNSIMIREEL